MRLVRPLRVTVGAGGIDAWGSGSAKVTAGTSEMGGGVSMSEMVKSISSGGVDVVLATVSHGSRNAGGRYVDGAIGGGLG